MRDMIVVTSYQCKDLYQLRSNYCWHQQVAFFSAKKKNIIELLKNWETVCTKNINNVTGYRERKN